MNRTVLSLDQTAHEAHATVGGKAAALAALSTQGMQIPRGIVIAFDAYHRFVEDAKLSQRIFFELNRKPFSEMRWEEIWDASLRIRNMFLKADLPPDVETAVVDASKAAFGDVPLVLRSSASGEDSASNSFAGLHDSYVNVRGSDSLLKHVKLVWASLWSDRALLYRKELGLDVRSSAMAVIIQELLDSRASGVAFSVNPMNADEALIEGVYGLNQGLVDGTIQPDRWALDRKTGAIRSHTRGSRQNAVVPDATGTKLAQLDPNVAEHPPLKRQEIARVFHVARLAENFFAAPQDVEWTFVVDDLVVLQSRPITSGDEDQAGDPRPWYLSLHRTFDNLAALRQKIEGELLPEMARTAEQLATVDPADLDDAHLADEIERRQAIVKQWQEVYKRDCIPFAHGMRLFGRVYNDVINPSDPHEFIDLLHSSSMIALERNRKLQALAASIRDNPDLADKIASNRWDAVEPKFLSSLDDLISQSGVVDLTGSDPSASSRRQPLASLLLQMAHLPGAANAEPVHASQDLERRFIASFGPAKRSYARDLLELGRASYRLRDDDNAYVYRIKRESQKAVQEGRRRIVRNRQQDNPHLALDDIVRALRDPKFHPQPAQPASQATKRDAKRIVKARQLTGQPASPGVASGPARVIRQPKDAFAIKKGEILVCDAIQPSMTFAVVLAAGIVERRGGMLIHGAIIAREYGLPCVTGVPHATQHIQNGDFVTVDGYLAIVTVG